MASGWNDHSAGETRRSSGWFFVTSLFSWGTLTREPWLGAPSRQAIVSICCAIARAPGDDLCAYDAPMTDARNEYVLGTDTAELTRLGLQHRLWGDSAHALWRRGGIKPGSAVLDVGCGPGFAGLDLAMLVGPDGCVVGVDESAHFVGYANVQASARNLDQFCAHCGDVQDIVSAIGGEGDQFDFAYARWVLCFVDDVAGVVLGVHEALKVGGRFLIQDYFNYIAMRLAPGRPIFEYVRDAIARSWVETGGDSDVMGLMPRLLREAGFEVDDIRVDQRIARPGEFMWAWPDSFWITFVPRLVAGGYITEQESASFFEEWRSAAGDPDTFFALPPVYEIVATKR